MMVYTEYAAPVGLLLLCSDGDALTGLWLEKNRPDLVKIVGCDDLPVFIRVKKWLDGYFSGAPRELDVSLAPSGTPFQKKVWEILLTVPYGEAITYGAIAGKLAPGMSAQAVGQAVRKNPISIVIPCHRCLGAGGKLTGYSGGLENKKWLLTHEGIGFDQ